MSIYQTSLDFNELIFYRNYEIIFKMKRSEMKIINVHDKYLDIITYDNQNIIIDLGTIDSIDTDGYIELFIYTSEQYDKEAEVDYYEFFNDDDEDIPYRESFFYERYIEKELNRSYIVCNGMLEIYTKLK